MDKEFKDKVANILYISGEYEQFYYNFSRFGDEFFEDLRSYLVDELLLSNKPKKIEKLKELFQQKKLKYYVLNMVKISLNYPTSPFYKKYIINATQKNNIDFDSIVYDDCDKEENQNDQNNIYYKILDSLQLNFIEQEIVKEYFSKNTSYRKLAKEFDVSYSFIYLIIKEVKQKIRKEYESSTQN